MTDNKPTEDIVEIWLEEAKTKAVAGTRAEKAVALIEVLYSSVKHLANCERCATCSVEAETVLEECEDIVERI